MYITPKIDVIKPYDDIMAVLPNKGSILRTENNAKRGFFASDDNDLGYSGNSIYHNGYISAGGFESSIPKPQSVWGD
jgi:hypothetical protein